VGLAGFPDSENAVYQAEFHLCAVEIKLLNHLTWRFRVDPFRSRFEEPGHVVQVDEISDGKRAEHLK
jgi:hypothetical protein